MSDNTKKPEQSTSTDQNQDPTKEQVTDLPEKPIADSDAQSVKGGAAAKSLGIHFK